MKKILFLLLVLFSGKLFSQVNLQSGSATFSLPMFNWQDNKSRLNSVVGLSYSSGNGLKVNDIASNVGQGWNMIAGGMITRIQHGEPDDQPARAGNGTIEDITKYPPGYLYDPIAASVGVPEALIRYPIFKDKNHMYKQHNAVAADKELDHFAFQFNGRSGVFVLNKHTYNAGDNSGQGVSLGDSKIKITFLTQSNMVSEGDYKGIRTTIKSFSIHDENGLIYKFTKHQLTKVLKTFYCDKTFSYKISQPKFKKDKVYYETSWDDAGIVNPYVINGWYLTEIEDALTHRKINLNYDTWNMSAENGLSMANYTSNNTGIFTPSRNYSVISRTKSITKTPVITSIALPDGHNVVFNYGKARVDLVGDYALSSVAITYQGRYLSKYQLSTSYFILNRYGHPVTDYQKKAARLCLRSVKKIGVDLKADDPPYLFDYYLGSSLADDFVPPPFCHVKDIWGFYNGNNCVDATNIPIPVSRPVANLSNNDVKGLCFNGANISSAKTGYAKNGLLKQITYPTGGSLNYEYAQTLFFENGQNKNVGGVNVSKTSVTDGGYQNDCNNAITTNYNYVVGGGSGQSSYWGFEAPDNTLTTYNSYVPKDKYIKGKLFPPSVGCDYRFKYPGILSREQAVNISWMGQMLQTAMNIYSTISTIADIIKIVKGGDPVSMIIQVILEIGLTCIGDGHVSNTTDIFYNADLKASNPLPAQFKRVEVVEGSGTNGKIVHEFTSPDYYSIWEPVNKLYSAKQRFAYWAYGLPHKTTVSDAAGNPVTETVNEYNITKSRVGYYSHYGYSAAFTSCKSLVEKSTSQKYTEWSDPAVYNNLATYVNDDVTHPDVEAELYFTWTGRSELDTTYERVYKQGSSTQYLETITNYEYSSYNFQVSKIISTKSNGDRSFKEINYSGEGIGSSGPLLQNYILNVPVRTASGIKKGNQDYYVDEKITEFATIANGDVKPSKILEKRLSQPLSQLWNIPFKEIQTFTYDATGNLIGLKDEGNHVVTNIYGYDDKYVIASVVNAEPVIDKPAYSSFETQGLGGWLTTNGTNFVITTAVTGSRSFGLTSSQSLFTILNTAKPYRLSVWATNTITVSNATLVKSSPQVNGFTYYEYNINQGASTVTVGGNATIDELRVYPQTARMRTVTYDPLVGKTSECDENNRITYYEYDDNSRLRFIKDENRHIVKMYEYNVAKKPTGCPVTYTNLRIAEIFVKQCDSLSEGSQVEYIIPAGKYTSTVSQEAVDLQVQNELNALGQSNANTYGTCSSRFYNAALSVTFTKEGCDIGYEGHSYTYTVPAGRYSSIISQAEADEQAQDDMDANGQTFANLLSNDSCVISYTAVWIGTGLEQCSNGHRMVQVKDENPNSSTYNQMQWIDNGVDPTCGATECGSSNCSGEEKRCVNGYCETGLQVYTGQEFYNGKYYCIYHYEWSDGFWSQNYFLEVSTPGLCPYTN